LKDYTQRWHPSCLKNLKEDPMVRRPNPSGQELRSNRDDSLLLNDVQSQLNSTPVHRVIRPTSIEEIEEAIVLSRNSQRPISVAGGRHSMGGQQFGKDALHLDMTGMNRVLTLDEERGLVTAEAGIQWPDLIEGLHGRQVGRPDPWTIREKQTGVDAVTLGGSLSSNVHGRGLTSPPIVHDVESFQLMDADGKVHKCSRADNAELFALAIGGYGLFGIITRVQLHLVRRFKVRRKVERIEVKDLLDRYHARLAQGFVFGDCQYSADLTGDAELHPGVLPFYEPVNGDIVLTENPAHFSASDWARLYRLIRTDKHQAFEEYADHYLRTDGQVYWSDTHQLASEFVGHREAVEAKKGTEMITEVYLRHENLLPFFASIRTDLIERRADITYGTIRFIRADRETFLPWAKEDAVCVVCNLHVRHTPAGIAKAQGDFRAILDRVVEFKGSFFLTYHRWATPGHVLACYPSISEFFRLKRKYDPSERFQSEWYRHYVAHFA
jgi:FAD/FMN-containing dehydrogenase